MRGMWLASVSYASSGAFDSKLMLEPFHETAGLAEAENFCHECDRRLTV